MADAKTLFFAPPPQPPPQRSENVKKVLDRGQKFRLFSPLQCVRGKKEGGKEGGGVLRRKKEKKTVSCHLAWPRKAVISTSGGRSVSSHTSLSRFFRFSRVGMRKGDAHAYVHA